MSFATKFEHKRWNDAVVEAIALGQRVGSGWILSGDIQDDPHGWSNEVKVAGVASIEWKMLRNEDHQS